MPLTRDRIIGHDTERLAFRFTMLNDADTVEATRAVSTFRIAAENGTW